MKTLKFKECKKGMKIKFVHFPEYGFIKLPNDAIEVLIEWHMPSMENELVIISIDKKDTKPDWF